MLICVVALPFLFPKWDHFFVQKWILLILWSFPWGRGHKKSSKTLIRENLANFHIKRSSPGNLQAHKVCFWYEWFRYLPKWPISAKFQILTRHKILKNPNFKNSCNRIVDIISGYLHAKFQLFRAGSFPEELKKIKKIIENWPFFSQYGFSFAFGICSPRKLPWNQKYWSLSNKWPHFGKEKSKAKSCTKTKV